MRDDKQYYINLLWPTLAKRDFTNRKRFLRKAPEGDWKASLGWLGSENPQQSSGHVGDSSDGLSSGRSSRGEEEGQVARSKGIPFIFSIRTECLWIRDSISLSVSFSVRESLVRLPLWPGSRWNRLSDGHLCSISLMGSEGSSIEREVEQWNSSIRGSSQPCRALCSWDEPSGMSAKSKTLCLSTTQALNTGCPWGPGNPGQGSSRDCSLQSRAMSNEELGCEPPVANTPPLTSVLKRASGLQEIRAGVLDCHLVAMWLCRSHFSSLGPHFLICKWELDWMMFNVSSNPEALGC